MELPDYNLQYNLCTVSESRDWARIEIRKRLGLTLDTISTSQESYKIQYLAWSAFDFFPIPIPNNCIYKTVFIVMIF